MSKKNKDKHRTHDATPDVPATGSRRSSISREDYDAQLHILQVELVKLQRHFIGCKDKILVLLEGRDAAGKDGNIKRIVEYLSPRDTRVVARRWLTTTPLWRALHRELAARILRRRDMPQAPSSKYTAVFHLFGKADAV